MSSEITLRHAARAIRPFLAELLEEREAGAVDRRLADLLCSEGVSDPTIDSEIGKVLMGHPDTHRWSAAFLERRCPPAMYRAQERNFSAPPGDGQPVGFNRYVCPHNDFDWYERAVGIPVPDCPTHNCALVRAEPDGGDGC